MARWLCPGGISDSAPGHGESACQAVLLFTLRTDLEALRSPYHVPQHSQHASSCLEMKACWFHLTDNNRARMHQACIVTEKHRGPHSVTRRAPEPCSETGVLAATREHLHLHPRAQTHAHMQLHRQGPQIPLRALWHGVG